MMCTEKCSKHWAGRGPVWNRADTRRAREAGWFIYDSGAPAWFKGKAIAGLVLCPKHRATPRGKFLEALHNEAIDVESTPMSTEQSGMTIASVRTAVRALKIALESTPVGASVDPVVHIARGRLLTALDAAKQALASLEDVL